MDLNGGGWPNKKLFGDEHVESVDYHFWWAAGNTVVNVRTTNGNDNHGYGPTLDAGNEVNVVWQAESGGKTQTLFKYSVQ
jgi:hypothetical protein